MMDHYRIRAHHGMCLAYFRGKGYSDEFSEHMKFIKESLEGNPNIYIVEETDDICRKCPNNRLGICEKPEKTAGYDKKVLELCGLAAGTQIEWKQFEKLVRENILETGKRSAVCGDCQWNSLCR